MAVDITYIEYVVTYFNAQTFNTISHDDNTFGVNLNTTLECALIQVERAYNPNNDYEPTDLFMVINGPSRDELFYGYTFEDLLKVFVKFKETSRPWPNISLMFPEDIGLPNNTPVDEAIHLLSIMSMEVAPRLDNYLSEEQEMAILTLLGKIKAGSEEAIEAAEALNELVTDISAEGVKELITKSAIAGNIFNSFTDCAAQSAFVYLFDCLAYFESEAEDVFTGMSLAACNAITGFAAQVGAAIDIIQTTALLPLTYALRTFIDPTLHNGVYVIDAFSKYTADIIDQGGGLPLEMLVDIGKCMADDPEVAVMLRTKDRILGAAKDKLISTEAMTLFESGYSGVDPLKGSLLALTGAEAFKAPTAKLKWGVALPWYLDIMMEGASKELYLLALDKILPLDRFSWYSVHQVMEEYTTVKSEEEFNSLNSSIVYPDFIAPDASTIISAETVTLRDIATEFSLIEDTAADLVAMANGQHEITRAYDKYGKMVGLTEYNILVATENLAVAQSNYDHAAAIGPICQEGELLLIAEINLITYQEELPPYLHLTAYLGYLSSMAQSTCEEYKYKVELALIGDSK